MSASEPTIVVVDDDASVRGALGRLFRSAGYRYAAFGSAEQFLAGSGVAAAGCLIVDVHMPGMRGLELQARCARLRPSLPVIIITAFEDAEAERRALAGGAVAYLRKPFDGEILLRLVAQASAISRQGTASSGGVAGGGPGPSAPSRSPGEPSLQSGPVRRPRSP